MPPGIRLEGCIPCFGRLREWHLLMPNCVRESLATSYPAYWDMPMKGMKAPSAKVLRIMVAFQRYMSGEDE